MIMDQQGICNNKAKDSSILESNESSETWLVKMKDDDDNLKGLGGRNQRFSGGAIVSKEEQKIRGELEMEVERDLEEEIKDEICHLALKLHRLYQHQKDRNAGKLSFCEVNINIQMEGGTKIEIKDIKIPSPPEKGSRSENYMKPVGKNIVEKRKKFDWATSLRSSGGQGWKV